jgi:hypothetical protein
MMRALKIGLGLLVVGTALILVQQQRSNGRLRAEIEALRQQNRDLGELQAENRQLVAAAPNQAEAIRMKREELARLQAQIVAWQKQVETLEQRRVPAVTPAPRPPPLVPLPGMMTLGEFQNVGRDTPAHLFQTRMWAMLHEDWQTLADSWAWDPETLAELNATFSKLSPEEQARFGTPERMALMSALKRGDGASSTPELAGPGPKIVAENVIGPDDVDIVGRTQISSDQTKDHPPMRVHRFPDGWKFMPKPVSAAERKATIDAIPPTQRATLGKN